MKTAIVYASVHHGNTKKIIDAIAKENEVELIDQGGRRFCGSCYWFASN